MQEAAQQQTGGEEAGGLEPAVPLLVVEGTAALELSLFVTLTLTGRGIQSRAAR